MRRTAFALLAMVVAAPAFAEVRAPSGAPTCDKRPAVMSQLENKYSEKPVAIGVANNGGIVEVLTTKEGNTWTIVITLPNGMTCLVAAGEDWETFSQVAFGPKA